MFYPDLRRPIMETYPWLFQQVFDKLIKKKFGEQQETWNTLTMKKLKELEIRRPGLIEITTSMAMMLTIEKVILAHMYKDSQMTGEMDVVEDDGNGGDVEKESSEKVNECKKNNKGGFERQDQEEEQVSTESGGGVDGDDEVEDEDDRNFIRIRSQDDGIFEQEEDDDDDEYLGFPVPQVELQELAPSGVRKRKQEINVLTRDDMDAVEISDDEYVEYSNAERYLRSFDPGLFRKKSKEQRVSPLYMLNPDDYAHDQKKQLQIRRAIITYRHHQEKKETILHQQEQIKKLTSHNEALKAKVMELSGCGCPKNRTVNLDVVDVIIPAMPLRLYAKGNRSGLGTPINQIRSSSPGISSKTSLEKPFLPPKLDLKEEPKPLVNITTSLLANLNSKTMATATSRPVPMPPVSKVLTNGTVPLKMSTIRHATPSSRFLKLNGLKTSSTFSPTTGLLSSLKSEPGISSSSVFNGCRTTNATHTTPSFPTEFSLASIKSEPITPATATPVSRIVFAKKGVNTSSAVQTASQLVFGTTAVQNGANAGNHNTKISTHTPPPPPLTASQLAFASRAQNNIPGGANPFRPVSNMRSTNQQPQIFRTPSGQVLKLVQPGSIARQLPAPMGRLINLQQHYQHIKPKPPTMSDLDSEAIKRQIDKRTLEEMWKELDDNEDEEIAILEAIDGTSPTQRNRKQTINQRKSGPATVLTGRKPGGEEIELSRYADIVFEEAD